MDRSRAARGRQAQHSGAGSGISWRAIVFVRRLSTLLPCSKPNMAVPPHNMDPRLPQKIQENVADIGSLARQVLRSSKSSEMLLHAAKNFASQEGTVESSLQTLKKMDILASHLRFQAEAIERNVEVMDNLQDQLTTLQR